jgi:hypothetical protein
MNDTTAEAPKRSWWQRLTSGLKRTSNSLGTAVADLLVYMHWLSDARAAHEGRSAFSRPGGGSSSS